MTATYPEAPGAKVPGPSQEAADAMRPCAKTLRDRALNVLKLRAGFNLGGMTADEVAAQMGADILAVRPRLTELQRHGAVHDSGLRRLNKSGRRATVWELIEP